ncbi:GntR family transcriptional regulator [Prauserella endophytica]|uniref:GntR family transcriptional regulator n=1 Tax=Prauserella endophytica TaxID=1592324 RepID=A0ABY2S496_9PSEU|nr:GntR family transcriptional regulator [Prauserella endophytica]TKG70554.1 GntR family transcriptional regulator [Prauserella endophytica]
MNLSTKAGAAAPSRSTSRGEAAYRELRALILSGKFEPGARLQPDALASALSMSPTPVREAIQRLAAEGLVQFVPQKGAQVVTQSLADMLAIYQLRMVLEPVAFSLSIRRGTPEWSIGVRRSWDALTSSSHPGDTWNEEFEQKHADFHFQLISACDSEALLREIDRLRAQSLMYRAVSRAPHGPGPDFARAHEPLLAAALEGDHSGAIDVLVDHIASAVDDARLAGDVVLSEEQRSAAKESARLLAASWNAVTIRPATATTVQ